MVKEHQSINLIHLRLIILIGVVILCSFILTDLALLPNSLHSLYLDSRLFMQLPICLLLFGLTFLPRYIKIHSLVVSVSMLLLVYINYWLILQCWQLANFAFPYEGTVIYSLFTLLVFRIRFDFAVAFSAVAFIGFLVLVLNYPVYGKQSGVSIGFVLAALVVGLIGVYEVKKAFDRLTIANEKLLVLNEIDPLTNILNRRSYEKRFAELLELGKRNGTTVAVFLIDLDSFKSYNDGYGHVQGDEVIKLQASLLSKVFRRTTDIVARYGGEEFIVVAANCEQSQCIELAQQILAEWVREKVPHGKILGQDYVSCSVGFCLEKLDLQSDALNLVKKADKALYQAKAQGRNCYVQNRDA